MPKFLSRGLQYLGEKLGREVTEDKDFEKLLTQINKTEKGFSAFRTVMQNFNSYMEKFSKFFSDISNALTLIYTNTPYYAFIEEFLVKQEIINVHIEDMSKLLVKLVSRSSEWDKIFEDGKKQLVERENKRKEYDHYEQKLLKIEGDQNKKKNTDLLIRNQEKYSKALKEYLEISEKSFEVIKNSIKLSWELANPILGELFISEKNIFEKISSHLTDFGNVTNDFQEIMDKTFNQENVEETEKFYDPKKCIRSKTLMKRNDDNFNYVHNFARNTSTCAKGFKDREIKFMEIKDDFSIYYQE
jgi:hypothetical protein